MPPVLPPLLPVDSSSIGQDSNGLFAERSPSNVPVTLVEFRDRICKFQLFSALAAEIVYKMLGKLEKFEKNVHIVLFWAISADFVCFLIRKVWEFDQDGECKGQTSEAHDVAMKKWEYFFSFSQKKNRKLFQIEDAQLNKMTVKIILHENHILWFLGKIEILLYNAVLMQIKCLPVGWASLWRSLSGLNPALQHTNLSN